MRIIGGLFRGRRLAAVGKGDETARLRPTADRVRESLFNVLMSRFGERIEGARVLDLFSGTGALGLEALSRGAKDVIFVENGRKALGVLRRNIELCGVAGCTTVISQDACRVAHKQVSAFDLVFLDPPYGKGLGGRALENAITQDALAKRALIVWEDGQNVHLPAPLTLIETRKYGDTVITLAET